MSAGAELPAGIIRPTVARVDLDRLSGNLEAIRTAGRGRPVLAVVKADAYGHGAVEVARALAGAAVASFGVALVEEGLELRRAGIAGEVLVLGGVPARGAAEAVAHDLTAAVFDLDQARSLDRAARAGGRRVPVHVKVDTGMARLGVPAEEVADFARDLALLDRLEVRGLFTALAAGDDPKAVAVQVERLERARDALARAGLRDLQLHAANSAALTHAPASLLDLVRPGLALYGLPGTADRGLALQPVLELTTEIAALRTLAPGSGVGYGGTHVCDRPTRVATLPIGYDDGLPRLLSRQGAVLVRGCRAPILGTVSMDLTMVDVTGIAGVAVGEPVAIIGRQDGEEISAVEIAGHARTIPWEVLCRIGSRVPRLYLRDGLPSAVRLAPCGRE